MNFNLSLLAILFVFILACQETPKTEPTEESVSSGESLNTPSSPYELKTIYTPNLGWGYQIFEGDKMLINQLHVPAVQGNQGFQTKAQAETAGNYVLNKVSQGQFPPTITVEELQSIGAI